MTRLFQDCREWLNLRNVASLGAIKRIFWNFFFFCNVADRDRKKTVTSFLPSTNNDVNVTTVVFTCVTSKTSAALYGEAGGSRWNTADKAQSEKVLTITLVDDSLCDHDFSLKSPRTTSKLGWVNCFCQITLTWRSVFSMLLCSHFRTVSNNTLSPVGMGMEKIWLVNASALKFLSVSLQNDRNQ